MFQVCVIRNHAKMAEHAHWCIGNPVINANAREIFQDNFVKVSILTQLLCDPYTVTYQTASLVTLHDLISLTKPHAYTISPFWHIVPQSLPNLTHITDYRIRVLNSLLIHFHPNI